MRLELLNRICVRVASVLGGARSGVDPFRPGSGSNDSNRTGGPEDTHPIGTGDGEGAAAVTMTESRRAGCFVPRVAGACLCLGLSGQTSACGDSRAGVDATPATTASENPGADTVGDQSSEMNEATADCSAIPLAPLLARRVRDITASEEFTFVDGHLVNVSVAAGHLGRTPRVGDYQLLVPGIVPADGDRYARGIGPLPSGDLVMALPSQRAVVQVSLAGQKTPLASLPDANGVVVAADGTIFATGGSEGTVIRIDAQSGEASVLAAYPGVHLDGIAWAPRHESIVVGELEGRLHRLDLDDEGGLRAKTRLADIPVQGNLDGIATDACGNVYAAELQPSRVWRVSPGGETVEVLADIDDGRAATPSLHFGDGSSGWLGDGLYVMTYESGLYEIAAGVLGAAR